MNYELSHTGYLRAAACVPAVALADPAQNVQNILALARQAAARGADVAVFPEMSVTGYTCGDLFHSQTLLDASDKALDDLRAATADLDILLIVGAPLRHRGALYNCAFALASGRLLAVVPKTYIPTYNEFYERRWWTSGTGVSDTLSIDGEDVPFGTDTLIQWRSANVAIELCEDLWVASPPSCRHALAGADAVCNLSASDTVIGKYPYLRSLVRQQSARCQCAYVYAGAGWGESTTDLVFSGPALVYERGQRLAEGPLNLREPHCVIADIDIDAIRHDRLHTGTWADCARQHQAVYTRVTCDAGLSRADGPLLRPLSATPFVPDDPLHLRQRCDEITDIQVMGLARRLQAAHARGAVIGISGGLDSTLALLVACKAFDLLGMPRAAVTGVTMPGFGTTSRTHDNAVALMRALGVTIREIPIADAVRQHFRDIGHDEAVHDVTYENSQARYRTMLLMDIANQQGALVIGTGDLSELALGWATYNGDHMSMYGVNASVPKTLVRYLVANYAEFDPSVAALLRDIVDTPVSPELLPADADGHISQRTEDLVGPYELHDFFLYHTLRYGSSPRRVFALATQAFDGRYQPGVVARWMQAFYRRFFAQQFKRSCLPDGPKVGSVCLSPRGDWRMPSDASAAAWLRQCDDLLSMLNA